ncbi:MAG: hypothetical protein M3O35_18905 [Acidobacteriota bacterium]|nr:hypothetical protein [Acidobacteriota bacterium]
MSLREYLDAHFWLPFSKQPQHFARNGVRRVSVPYAGMVKAADDRPLAKLRAAYQEISQPMEYVFDTAALRQAVAAARADNSLTRREKEEVELIDAKIDLRAGQPGEPELLHSAKGKFQKFLRTARTPEFLSEARGWLARVHYLLGEQTAAGKLYLDELNRNGSNLSRETLLTSLKMTYGYDGGPFLLAHLEEYFDTPEHAAFAIQMATNPHLDRPYVADEKWRRHPAVAPRAYDRVNVLLEKHSDLLQSNRGADALALLGMRTALRMGDPPSALRVAARVPQDAAIRAEPDFLWMLASAQFLSHEYAAAEDPLLKLFNSSRSTPNQKAAAAYALCGVYQKNKNAVEQLHFALWLHDAGRKNDLYVSYQAGIEDYAIYWAPSGWDLNLLLEAEASIDALESFVTQYPNVAEGRLVRYALAVRLARKDLYEESARIYESIHAGRRAPRMRQLATLYEEANTTQEGKYRLAAFIAANPDGIYFNDTLWGGYQRYALVGSGDSRLTREERRTLMENERTLKDDQEERWRAYLILRDLIQDCGKTSLGRRAAQLAIRCLRGINERFERQEEIRKADRELTNWLRG